MKYTPQQIDIFKESVKEKNGIIETLERKSKKYFWERKTMIRTPYAQALDFLIESCDNKINSLKEEIDELRGKIYFGL